MPANTAPTIKQPIPLSFAAKVDYATGSVPKSVTSADVNNDGKVDLLVANGHVSNKVSVLLGNGDGTFADKVDYSTGIESVSVTSTDVNNDAKADLLVANYGGDSVSVLLGNGDGTFAGKVDYATASSPLSLTSADVNNDGKADLLVANYVSNNVSVLLGNGNGTFTAKVDYTTGVTPRSVTSADVNGDGKADLLVANEASKTVSVLLGNGDGTFGPKVDYATGNAPRSVTSTDVNSDGKADLLVANYGGDSVSVLLGNGDGTFAAKVDYATGSDPNSVTSADFNNDGKTDLLVANMWGDSVSVLLGNGDGTFAAKVDYATGDGPYSVTSADVNSDGKADMVVVNSNSNTVSVFLNNGTPAATAFTEGANVASTPVAIDTTLILGDTDNSTLASATVSITANLQSAEDLLAFTNDNAATYGNIAATYTSGTGVLALTSAGATATVAQWQAALRAVTYSNSSDTPNTSNRTVSFVINDGTTNSSAITKTVSITAVNDLPAITSADAVNVAENTTAVTTVTSTDADGDTVTYSITGGADQAKFNINANTGALVFATAPDYEIPTDADSNNSYIVQVTADDSHGGTVNQTITATVTNVAEAAPNTAPVITSAAAVNVAENTTAVTTVTSTDADGDTVTYSITGGADQALFSINANTGALAFATAPDFETPTDADSNNSYIVQVTADDGNGGTVNQTITATVTDVAEAAPNTAPSFFTRAGIVTTSAGTGFSYGYDVAVQPDDGKILVVGQYGGSNTLLRYNTDGSLDTTFDADGKLTVLNQGNSVAALSGGKILVAGAGANAINALDVDFALARYNTDGSLDTTFGVNGIVTTDFGSTEDYNFPMLVQADGRFVVAGRTFNGSDYDFALARYNADGSLDTTFDTDGKLTTDLGGDEGISESPNLALQSDNKILLADSVNGDFALARYNSDGSLDASFGTGGTVVTTIGTLTDYANSVVLQGDGKILVTGYSMRGGYDDFSLARFNADGSLDTTFDTDGKVITLIGAGSDYSFDIALQSDGKILQTGLSQNGGKYDIALVRYNTDGSLDSAFGNSVNTLDATPTYTEGGAAVVLDSNVQIYDPELLALGKYFGATLTITRHGGASSQDVFTASGTLGALTEGANLTLTDSGLTIGTVTTNSNGTLTLTFNNTYSSQARVNIALQQIAYSNSSDTPPASVQLDWSFSDGNTGDQGTGGAGIATGSTTVSITNVNYAPTIKQTIQLSFAAKVDFTTGSHPTSVSSADVNSDGKTDLLVANVVSNNVSVLLGNGNGTFAAKTNYATGAGPWSVASADVNNDGKVDLLVANESSDSVSVLLGNGNGTFASTVNYTTGDEPRSVTNADFNNDGKVDLLVANSRSNTASVLLGNGDGTFAAKVDYTTGVGPWSVASADVNSDGKADLVAANYNSNTVSVSLNNGTPATTAFTEGANTPSIPVAIDTSLILGDTDNSTLASATVSITANLQSAEDLLAFSNTNAATYGNIAATYTGGTGVLALTSAGATATVAQWQAALRAVTYSNISETPNTANRTVSFVINDGTTNSAAVTKTVSVAAVNDLPAITSAAAVNVAENTTAVTTVTSTDADGDTVTYSITGGADQTKFNINATTGALSFITAPNFEAPTDTDANNSYIVRVTTNDSHGGTVNQTITATVTDVADGNAAPTIKQPTQLSFADKTDYATGNGPVSIASADLNNDGTADLLVTNWNSASVSVLLNNGDGTFANKVDYATGVAPGFVTSADVNNDGTADLLVVNGSSNSVSVLLGNGNGTFVPKVDYTTGSDPRSVSSADANGDGKTDLFVANYSSNTVSVLLNNGDGTFAAKVDYTTGVNPCSVTSADVNNDGEADLLVPNAGSDTVSVLLGNGDGTFAARVDYATGSAPVSISSVDLNGDSKVDIVVTNLNSETVSVLLGNGDGTFADKVDYPTGSGPYSVSSDDMNGDGIADLLVSNTDSDTVSVLLGSGDGTFAPKVDYTTGSRPQSVTSADVNSDGKSDLLVANSSSNTVSVFLNNGTPAATAFTEGSNAASTPVAIDTTLILGDTDNSTLASATVSITANLQSSEDLLAFINDNAATYGNIAATYTGGTGVLALTSAGATATVAQWQAALRAVTYSNSSETPNTANRTVSFVINDGIADSNAITKTVSVTAVNDLPAITSAAAVNVAENSTAVTTVTSTDADGDTVTYSITGGADQAKFSINANTGALVFATAPDYEVPTDADSNNSYLVQVTANDSHGGTVNQTITATVTNVNETPVVPPVVPPVQDEDSDGISSAVEGAAPSLPTGNGTVSVTGDGDGNGDGIADNQQVNVTSAPLFVPGQPGQQTYITLVADADQGIPQAGSTASITGLLQQNRPAEVPSVLQTPLGIISFSAEVQQAGVTETFSLFVDSGLGANGYWAQDNNGIWCNLATAVETVGDMTRVDFIITDGGLFDSDGLPNGVVGGFGAVGSMPLSITGVPVVMAGNGFWF